MGLELEPKAKASLRQLQLLGPAAAELHFLKPASCPREAGSKMPAGGQALKYVQTTFTGGGGGGAGGGEERQKAFLKGRFCSLEDFSHQAVFC